MKEKIRNKSSKTIMFNSVYTKPELVYEFSGTHEVEFYGSQSYMFIDIPFINKSNKVNQTGNPVALLDLSPFGNELRAEITFDDYAIPLDKEIVIEELAINGVHIYTPETSSVAEKHHRDDLPDFIRVDITGPYINLGSYEGMNNFLKSMFGEMVPWEKKQVSVLCRISAFF